MPTSFNPSALYTQPAPARDYEARFQWASRRSSGTSANERFHIGGVEYNGLMFPAITNMDVESSPVYDDTDRTVKHVKWVVTIHCLLTREYCNNLAHDYADEAGTPHDFEFAIQPVTPTNDIERTPFAWHDTGAPDSNTPMSTFLSLIQIPGRPLTFYRSQWLESGAPWASIVPAAREGDWLRGGFENRDVGPFNSNVTDNIQSYNDVNWGPKPRAVKVVQAGDLGWEIVWTVEFCLDPWRNSEFFSGQGKEVQYGPLQATDNDAPCPVVCCVSYGASYSIDSSGYTTRTVNLSYEIHISKHLMWSGVNGFFNAEAQAIAAAHGLSVDGFPGGNSTMPSLMSADNGFDNFLTLLPVGFRRVSQSRTISKDRRRMDVTIVDQEFEYGIFPAGIANADLSYNVQNVQPGFASWQCSLSGSLEVAPPWHPEVAAQRFFLILFSKVNQIRTNLATVQPTPVVSAGSNGAEGTGATVIPTGLSFSVKLFTRATAFSCSFTVNANLLNILQAGGFWDKVTDIPGAEFDPSNDLDEWKAWRDSVLSSSLAPRGNAALVDSPLNDTVIEPEELRTTCNKKIIGIVGKEASHKRRVWQTLFGCDQIEPSNSWVAYENKIECYTTAPGTTTITFPLDVPADPAEIPEPSAALLTEGEAWEGGAIPEAAHQFAAGPIKVYVMTGRALRIQHSVSVPRLSTIAGIAVREKVRKIRNRGVVANLFGCPLYAAAWCIVYVKRNNAVDDRVSVNTRRNMQGLPELIETPITDPNPYENIA